MSHPQPAALSAVVDNNEEWQPHAPEEFQQVGTVGKIAIGLLGASTLTHLLSTWSDWNTYGVVNRYLGGMPNAENADLNRADAIAKVTAIPNVIISVAAAVVFVIWLWRARVNSEVLCQADHRRGHGWVLASWFCPGPNLWYPKQIVDDVWLASDPKTPVYADDLRRFRTPPLTSVWWVTWVGALLFDVVVRRVLMWMEPTVGTLRGIALAGTAALVLTAASAVAATLVIQRINEMQTSREWIPWWDQREPKLTAVPTYADADTSEQQAIAEPIHGPIARPTLRLEHKAELQPAGVGAIAGFEGGANAGFGGGGSTGFGGSGSTGFGSAGNGFGSTGDDAAAAKWSPFAPAIRHRQDSGPATQAFNPIESWREEERSAPQVPNPLGGPALSSPDLDSPSWSSPFSAEPSSPFADEAPADSPFAPTASPFTPDNSSFAPVARQEPPAQYDDAAYTGYDEPSRYEAPAEDATRTGSLFGSSTDDLIATAMSRWQSGPATSPSLPAVPPDPFSYQPVDEPLTRTSEPSYETSWSSYGDSYATPEPTAPEPAPEPAPAPVARAGRRAARVAVDSPSVIQPSAAESARLDDVPPPPRSSLPDDFLTPSAPLPPVPSIGPEPGYSPEPSYSSDYQSSYSDYDAAPEYTSYSSSYSPDSLTSSYDSYSSSSSDYTSYSSSYDPYSSSSSSYEPADSSSQDSYYSSSSEYTGYSSEYQPAAEEPAQEQPPSTTPRTHPRRRWH